jgi:hypothetical protein
MSLNLEGRRMECLRTAEKGRSEHPPERALRRFVLGTTSPAENRAIMVHLLRRCGRCSRLLAESGGALLKTLRSSAEKAS